MPREESLDPEDWDAFRALAHRAVDDMIDAARRVRDEPAWRPMPEAVRAELRAPAPREGRPAEEVYADFQRLVAPYNMGNGHPRFWGWVIGTGSPMGALASYLAASLNPNLGGGDHSGARVEQQVLAWCKEMMGFPPASSGILVSGGSLANLTGIAVARAVATGYAVRTEGAKALPRQLVGYGSEELHSSNARAFDVLGIGSDNLRSLPTDEAGAMRVDALRESIRRDREAGHQPFVIVGAAGTTNTGAIDPLDDLADVAREEGLWYHVDGAFGALARLSPALAPLVKGMERADSLAFDLHKWGYLPMSIGVTLVRDPDAHFRTFTESPAYLEHQPRGLASTGIPWGGDYGVELSREFRGLKAWMVLQNEGIEKMGRLIERNVKQAARLAELAQASPALELMAPVALNVVCFRFVAPGRPDERLDEVNREIVLRLQESGFATPSLSKIRSRVAIRCAIVNHRTTATDLDALADEVARLGRVIMKE